MIEPLESRIAPAAVYQYIEGDGDIVRLTTSKGTNADLAGIITTAAVGLLGKAVQKIDFAMKPLVFEGTSLTMTVTPNRTGGDGVAHIGAINAAGMDLGVVRLLGDLGQIDAGNAATPTPAVRSLTVGSMGACGTSTQAAGGDLTSTFADDVPKLVVRHDVTSAVLTTSQGAILQDVSIGGSLSRGRITGAGGLGKITVRGDVIGSPAANGGISGDLGYISATAGDIKSVFIGGSLYGGEFGASGAINADTGNIGAVTIRGSILGGDSTGPVSGSIVAFGRIGSVVVGGSIIAPISTDASPNNTGIRAGLDIGKVRIGGDVRAEQPSANPVFITAYGQAQTKGARNVGIGSVFIGGSIVNSVIEAGVKFNVSPVQPSSGNADTQIGSVQVKGNWIGSSLIVGVDPKNTVADADDALFTNNTPQVIASIAKLTIGGAVAATPSVMIKSGFTAEHFGSVRIGGVQVKLSALGSSKDQFGIGKDATLVHLWEV